MYIEEITLDGFKSFARRTTVAGLDPQFNAITGFNGSGKSNMQQVSERLRSWRLMCSIDAGGDAEAHARATRWRR